MTVKSSQFHGSRRKVKSSKQKPLAIIFMSDSNVYIPVKVYLERRIKKLLKSEQVSVRAYTTFIVFKWNKRAIIIYVG